MMRQKSIMDSRGISHALASYHSVYQLWKAPLLRYNLCIPSAKHVSVCILGGYLLWPMLVFEKGSECPVGTGICSIRLT